MEKKYLWEPIDLFESPGEFKRFLSWIEQQLYEKATTELEVESFYAGTNLNERWFKNEDTKEIWRLVEPDFPFKGHFNKVA